MRDILYRRQIKRRRAGHRSRRLRQNSTQKTPWNMGQTEPCTPTNQMRRANTCYKSIHYELRCVPLKVSVRQLFLLAKNEQLNELLIGKQASIHFQRTVCFNRYGYRRIWTFLWLTVFVISFHHPLMLKWEFAYMYITKCQSEPRMLYLPRV